MGYGLKFKELRVPVRMSGSRRDQCIFMEDRSSTWRLYRISPFEDGGNTQSRGNPYVGAGIMNSMLYLD